MICLWLKVQVLVGVTGYKYFVLAMHVSFSLKLLNVLLKANQNVFTGGSGSAQWILRWEFFG